MTVTKFVTQDSYADTLIVDLSYEINNPEELDDDILISSDVLFTMRDVRQARSLAPKIDNETATITAAADGVVTVQYEWSDGDLSTPGRYRGMFKVEISGDFFLYSPTLEPIMIIVLPNQDTTP